MQHARRSSSTILLPHPFKFSTRLLSVCMRFGIITAFPPAVCMSVQGSAWVQSAHGPSPPRSGSNGLPGLGSSKWEQMNWMLNGHIKPLEVLKTTQLNRICIRCQRARFPESRPGSGEFKPNYFPPPPTRRLAARAPRG